MSKREKNYVIRVAILAALNRRCMSLRELATAVGELRQVVQGNLQIMLRAGEVKKLPNFRTTMYGATTKKTAPLKARPLGRTINLCGAKRATPTQAGRSRGVAPRRASSLVR